MQAVVYIYQRYWKKNKKYIEYTGLRLNLFLENNWMKVNSILIYDVYDFKNLNSVWVFF